MSNAKAMTICKCMVENTLRQAGPHQVERAVVVPGIPPARLTILGSALIQSVLATRSRKRLGGAQGLYMENGEMKSERGAVGTMFWLMVVVAFWGLPAATAPAGSESKDTPKKEKPAPPDADAAREAGNPSTVTEIKPADIDARYGHPLQQMDELHRTALAQLELTEDEIKALEAKFDEEIAKIKEVIKSSEEVRAERADRITELKSQIQEAIEAGDRARAGSLVREMMMLDRGRANVRKKMIGIGPRLAEPLPEEKRRAFLKIFDEIRAKHMPPVKPVGFSPVLRTLNESELSEEQWEKINQAKRELSKALSKAHMSRDRELMARVEAEFRNRALDELNEEQLKKYLELERKHEEEDGWVFNK